MPAPRTTRVRRVGSTIHIRFSEQDGRNLVESLNHGQGLMEATVAKIVEAGQGTALAVAMDEVKARDNEIAHRRKAKAPVPKDTNDV